MRHRVEGSSTHLIGGAVTQPIGYLGMGIFVHRERKDQRHEHRYGGEWIDHGPVPWRFRGAIYQRTKKGETIAWEMP